MKIFIVIAKEIDNDEKVIEGVFSTPEKAAEVCDSLNDEYILTEIVERVLDKANDYD